MAFLSSPPPPPPFASSASFSSLPPPQPELPLLPVRRRRPPAFSIPNPFKDPNRIIEIGQVDVFGRKKLPDSVVDRYLKSLQNRKVPAARIYRAVEKVNKWFTEHGYVCSRLVVLQLPRFFNKSLVFFSAEPRVVALRRIAVDKDGKPEEGSQIATRHRTIANAIGIRLNEVFVWRPEGFGALMALGIFEYANAEVKVLNNEQVELLLYLKERPSGRIEPGAGMSSDGRVYGDVSIVDNNFMGRAQKIRVEWQKRLDIGRSAGGIAFEDMRVGAKIPLSFRIRAYRDSNSGRGIPANRVIRNTDESRYQRRMEATVGSDTPLRYEKDRDGIMMDIGYRPKETNMGFNLIPMFELIHPQAADRSGGPASSQMVLQTAFTHATRLPIDLPRSGHLVRIEQYIGSSMANPKEAFHKTIVRLSQYFKVGSSACLAAGSSIGLGSDNLPWHEQKSLGGASSVRGYEYGALGRYRSFGHGRVELRVPMTPHENLDEALSESDEKPAANDADEKEKTQSDAEGKSGKDQAAGPSLLEKFPPLVGVLYGDVALSDKMEGDILGASYGAGLRIGGVVAVHWSRAVEDGRSQLHFGLIDRSL